MTPRTPRWLSVSSPGKLPSVRMAGTQGSRDRAPNLAQPRRTPLCPGNPEARVLAGRSRSAPVSNRACLFQLTATLPPLRDLGARVAQLPAALPHLQQQQFKRSRGPVTPTWASRPAPMSLSPSPGWSPELTARVSRCGRPRAGLPERARPAAAMANPKDRSPPRTAAQRWSAHRRFSCACLMLPP